MGIAPQSAVNNVGAISGVLPSRGPAHFEVPYPLNWQTIQAEGQNFACEASSHIAAIPRAYVSSPLQLNVMVYNLEWWSLFDKGQPTELQVHATTDGNGATSLIKQAVMTSNFDIMAFQECLNGDWLSDHANFAGQYDLWGHGNRELCLAYRVAAWDKLDHGAEDVAADQEGCFWGRRAAQWMRLRHKATGAHVFFMNHHGPLPINSGGGCGGATTASNLLRVVSQHSQAGDVIFIVGDFNAADSSETIQVMKQHLNKLFNGKADGGIDNIFSNLPYASVVAKSNLGGGGSDHDALSITINLSP